MRTLRAKEDCGLDVKTATTGLYRREAGIEGRMIVSVLRKKGITRCFLFDRVWAELINTNKFSENSSLIADLTLYPLLLPFRSSGAYALCLLLRSSRAGRYAYLRACEPRSARSYIF